MTLLQTKETFIRPTGVYLLDFFCPGIRIFFLLLSPYLCFISSLYLDSVLGDDALIS